MYKQVAENQRKFCFTLLVNHSPLLNDEIRDQRNRINVGSISLLRGGEKKTPIPPKTTTTVIVDVPGL